MLVADVGAREGGDEARLSMDAALREALVTHPSASLAASRGDARFVVTGSVVELEDHAVGTRHEVRCRVSIILADRNGNMRGMLEGRAGARGDANDANLRRHAVRGAVRSAMRGLSQLAR